MAKKRWSETKIGQVSNLRWAYVSSVKMGHPVSKESYLLKILNIIAKGTRFQEHVDAVHDAKQVKRKRKR